METSPFRSEKSSSSLFSAFSLELQFSPNYIHCYYHHRGLRMFGIFRCCLWKFNASIALWSRVWWGYPFFMCRLNLWVSELSERIIAGGLRSDIVLEVGEKFLDFKSFHSLNFVSKRNLNPTLLKLMKPAARRYIWICKCSETFIVSLKCMRVTCQLFPFCKLAAKIVRIMKCKVYNNHVPTLETTFSL